ncbi:MAG: hypothetical protein ACOWWO_07100 [Peptococcaceae bacterium]
MKDRNDIEKNLAQAKDEADKFFSGFPEEHMHKKVFHNLESPHKNFSGRSCFPQGLVEKVSAFAICAVVLLAVIVVFSGGLSLEEGKMTALGQPISQQLLKLDHTDLNQWLHFFKISKPDKINDNLLAVIWEAGRNGDYEMVYSSLFENSSKPCSAALIVFPENQPSMAVISSRNEDNQYIHYRVIGYKDDQILTYLEQNYVTGGELEVVDGVLKEKRFIPEISVEDISPVVTYYIPYQATEEGDIILAAENLSINKGEHIAIIGDEETPIEALNAELFLNWETGRELLNANRNMPLLYAENPGQEDLLIKPLKGGRLKKISVEVRED